MSYCLGLLAVSLGMYGVQRLSRRARLTGLREYTTFFKLHYFFVGCLLSVFFPPGFSSAFENSLGPVLMLCLAWTGFYFGCTIDTRRRDSLTPQTVLFQLAEPIVVFGFAILAAFIFIYAQYGAFEFSDATLVFALFCSISLYRRPYYSFRYGKTLLYTIIHGQSPLHNIVGVIGLCLVTCTIRADAEHTVALGYTFSGAHSLFLLHLLVGVGCAIFLGLLYRGSATGDDRLLAMLAVNGLIGGLCYMFSLSPIFTGMLAGTFFINSTLQRYNVRELVTVTEEHMEKVVMFFAGFLLVSGLAENTDVVGYIIAGAVVTVMLRLSLKYLFARVWTTRFHAYHKGVSILWAGLTGQGVLAVAVALEYRLSIPYVPAVFALMLFAYIMTHASMVVYVTGKIGD